jgi:splicing factor U2AF subunit
MNVCDNLGDHLVGNVYIKFKYELDAESVSTVRYPSWYYPVVFDVFVKN